MGKKVLLLVVVMAFVAFAQVPQTISFQGRAHSAGEPIDGTRNLTFRLYDEEIGGTHLWEEVHMAVPITGGLFNVILGEGTSFADEGVDFSEQYWIGVRIGGTPELTPRYKLTSAPYALGGGVWQVDGSDIYYSAGNVGIGTDSPESPLEVEASFWPSIIKLGLGHSDNKLHLSSGSVWASISGSDTNRDDLVINHSTGNIGMGLTSPVGKVHARDDEMNGHLCVFDDIDRKSVSGNYGGLSKGALGVMTPGMGETIYTAVWGEARGTGATDVNIGVYGLANTGSRSWAAYFVGDATINGNLGIGWDTPQADLHIKQSASGEGLRLENNSSTSNWEIGTASTNNLWFKYNGSLKSFVLASDGTWTIASDRRLKNSIEPIGRVLDGLIQVEPVTYFWNDDSERTRRSIGLIAQDVAEHFPLAAPFDEEFGYYGINYDNIAVLTLGGLRELTEIVRQQQAQIEELKAEIEALKNNR